jgi:hypothetical protein
VEELIMKQMIELLEKVDDYSLIRGFDVCPVDPEATKAAVEEQIRKNPALAQGDLATLFETYAVQFVNTGPGRKALSEDEYAVHKAKFEALKEHECLTESLEIIPDFRNVEYWQKQDGRWGKTKIVCLGETVPSGAVVPDALTAPQQAEIAAQEKADRIAALSPEEKAAEKQAQIKAVIHEAVIKKQEAELEAEVNNAPLEFDPVSWVRERKSEIEAIYA